MAARGETGLTLIEMLVVLTIIGTMAGATMLGFGAARRDSTESEARRLAAQIQLAADRAMVDDAPIAFAWTKQGYGFLQQGGAADAGEAHGLPGGIRLDMGKAKPPLPIRLGGLGLPLRARLVGASERWAVIFDGATATAIREPAL